MESSKINHGGEEECSSSESGWTTYIASTYDDSNSSSESKGYKNNYQNEYVEDGESDDSMASDASSGPSHHQCRPLQSPLITSHGFGNLSNVQGKDNRKGEQHNKKAEKMKSTKEEPGYKGKSLLGNAFSRGKNRKNK